MATTYRIFSIIILLNGVNYILMTRASWAMPNREKGFYRAWQHLITFDPALSKTERKVLKDWPEDALIALTKALSELGISESNMQAYLEGHLLCRMGRNDTMALATIN